VRISVNIPSYKRHIVETLKYIPFAQVWVDEGEADAYITQNPKAQIVVCKKGIQGNLCRIRNHILRSEFARGIDCVIIVDDDMKGIFRFEGKKPVMYETKQLKGLFQKCAFLAREWGAKFWGLNVNRDKQVYREYTPFSTTSYIGGPFQAFLKGNECYYDEALPLKEDYDMTLQQLNKYRLVVRFNYMFYDVRQSEQEGGCATYRNYDREEKQLLALQKKWGSEIVRIDSANRSHNLKKEKVRIDYNPIIKVPIRGV
jgi:hypothetical protein